MYGYCKAVRPMLRWRSSNLNLDFTQTFLDIKAKENFNYKALLKRASHLDKLRVGEKR